jgi:anaerobic selenocysteine-containing dehydrogenase
VVFVNEADMLRLGFAAGDLVDLTTAVDGKRLRRVEGFSLVPYQIPSGSCAAYYPEANPLFPLDHHDPKAKTPSYKLLPVRMTASAGQRQTR